MGDGRLRPAGSAPLDRDDGRGRRVPAGEGRQGPAGAPARRAAALLEAVRRALALGEADLPRVDRVPRPPQDPALEERVERLKAARNSVAAQLGLDPGALCARATLEAIARAAPPPKDRAGLARIGELRRWQAEVLGDQLLQALR